MAKRSSRLSKFPDIHILTVMKHVTLPIVIEHDKDGYVAWCPSLQGCYTQGETYEEARENIRDAIKLHIKERLSEHEELPSSDSFSLSSIEVTV